MPLLPIVLIALANSPAPVLRPIAPVAPASEDDASRRTRNFARLVFSVNRGTGISSTDWNVLTRYADLVAGLDGHGYEFPGYLDDFRIAAPGKRVYGFATAMGLQRDPVQDGRFRALDRSEDAFLHVSDPASFVAVVLQGATQLHWVRDHRKDAGASYPNPIGVTSYAIESAPAADGPWTPAGAPVAESGIAYYQATVASTDATRWYRIRSRLADTGEIAEFSWPAQPDPRPTGFAWLRIHGDMTFHAGLWGPAPPSASDVRLEIGNLNGWGYPNPATAVAPPVGGVAEYSGPLSSYPTSGAWVMRARSVPQGVTTAALDPSRRNNRLVSSFGEHLFKPDHAAALAVHGARLAQMESLGLTGCRLDFVLDSWPSWYVPSTPAGLDAPWTAIEPRMLALLNSLKAGHPRLDLQINGAAATATWQGIFDYVPPAGGIDCEFLGWSSPGQTQPFRDADMLDAAIYAAHVRRVRVLCFSYAAADNIEARITSLARYWLVHSPLVYYQYMTADNHQSVDYFPEYDLDLGPPRGGALTSRADLVHGSVYRRRYEKGTALYNPGSSTVQVALESRGYLVSATGTHSPKQGGTGTVVFQGPVTSVTLAPKRGALVMREPVLGR
jgi:hypothetical protein